MKKGQVQKSTTFVFLLYLVVSMPFFVILMSPMVEAAAPPKVELTSVDYLSSNSIIISWIDPTNGLAGIEYYVYRDGVLIDTIAEGAVTEYTDTTLSPNFNYQYEISAHEVGTGPVGEGTKSDVIPILTKKVTDAPTLQGLVADNQPAYVLFTFTTDEQINSGKITYWQDQVAPTEFSFTRDTDFQTNYSVELSGLSAGEAYRYTVEVCNDLDVCTVSTEGTFFYGVDLQPPQTDSIVCPLAANTRLITIPGITEPYSSIDVSVNGVYKYSQDVSGSGQFALDNIPLDPQPQNQVTLDITDFAGNTNQFTCSIEYDSTPPAVTVDPLPSLVSKGDIDINVTTNEQIVLQVYNIPLEDTTPPGVVPNLVETSIDETQITISWDEASSDGPTDKNDISNYIVYRDGVPIATTKATERDYTDMDIISGTRYEYKIKAVDTSCNVGPFSSVVYVTALVGTKAAPLPVEITDFCSSVSPDIETTINTEFSDKISLRPGKNRIKIMAHDVANNAFEDKYDVTYDNKRPELEWTNLNDLSDGMVYVPEITVRGNVSEPATVYIVINGGTDDETVHEVETKASGYFSTTVELSRNAFAGINDDGDTVSAGVDRSTTKWPNQVEIYAIDPSGQKSETEKRVVNYGLCGGGNTDWQIVIDNVLPNEFVPRYLMEGIATIGFSFELNYFGSALYDGGLPTVNGIQVKKAPINAFDRGKYDLDWLNDGNIQINTIGDKTYGYVQLKFDPVDVPGSEDMSVADIEKEIAENHVGECLASSSTFGLDFGDYDPLKLGCVKVPLIFEVTYDSPNPEESARTQKQCMDFSIAIQPRIPPSAIPNAILESGVAVTDAVVKTIDAVQNVTTPLKQYSMYGCLASYVGWGVTTLYESASCISFLGDNPDLFIDFDGETATVIDAEGKSAIDSDDPIVATQAQNMLNCYNAKVASQEMWEVSNYVCDRVMCGGIPSFDNYVKTKKDEIENQNLDSFNEIAQRYLTTSSYCANGNAEATYKDFETDPYKETAKPESPFESVSKMNAKIMSLANFQKQGADKTWGAAYPELCEEEYLYEYQSACIFSKPLEESYCAKRKSQNSEDPGYVAICRANAGAVVSEALDSLKFCKQSEELPAHVRRIAGEYYLIQDVVGDGSQNIKLLTQDIAIATLNKEDWDRGYIELDKTDNKVSIEDGAGISFSGANFDGKSPQLRFAGNSCTAETPAEKACACAYGTSTNACCPEIGNSGITMPPAIATYFCEPTEASEADIINPTDGLLESLRCLCFNAIDAYLTQVKQVMTMLRDCFTTIIETGDGSAGICQHAVTVYVCDLMYTGLGCVKDFAKIGSGAAGDSLEAKPLRNVMDVLSLTGTKIETGVNGRYGDTAIFEALFVEKKLFNSICLFAFGLDWQLDLESIFAETSAIDIPIEPVMTCSANRRFQSFDPTTGIATYVYDVSPFILSGADGLTYDVDLVCTTGQCDDGLCDCAHVGEEKVFSRTGVFGQGSLNAGETLNDQEFIVVDANLDPYNKGTLRYDTVRLTARYKDNDGVQRVDNQECSIKEVGGAPPGLCFFDILSPDGPTFKCEVLSDDGATYFQIKPEAKKDSYCLRNSDGTLGSVDILFDQYSVMKKSKYPDQPLSRYLEITVTDSNGRAIDWNTQDDSNVLRMPITAEGQNMFGDQTGGNNVPIIRVDENMLSGGTDGRCNVMQFDGSLTRIGNTAEDTMICDGFSAVKLTQHTETVGTGADAKEVLKTVDIVFGEFNSDHEFETLSGYTISNDYPIQNDEISFYSSGKKIVAKFNEIKDDGVFYLETSTTSNSESDSVNVVFEILDDNQESVVSYNKKPQSVTVTVPISSDCEESSSEFGGTVTSLPDCKANAINADNAKCLCGTEQCSLGQVCCLKEDSVYSNIGFCGSYDEGTNACDSKPVVLSDLSVVEEDGVLIFSNIVDEFGNKQIFGDEVYLYVSLIRKDAAGKIIESHENVASSKQITGVGTTTSTRAQYEDIRVYLSSFPLNLATYDVVITFVDKAGNKLQDQIGTLKKESTGYIFKK